MIACPSCGARNPEGAAWCTLCAVRLGRADAASGSAPPDGAPGRTARSLTSPAVAVADGAALDRPPSDSHDGVPRWTCPRCEGRTPLTEDACRVCGTSIFDAHGADRDREVDKARAARLRFVPGVAHVALGDAATGAMVVAVICLAGLFAVLLVGGGLVVGSVAVLLAGVTVWGAAAIDVALRLEGRPPILTGARLLAGAVAVVLVVLAVTRPGASGA